MNEFVKKDLGLLHSFMGTDRPEMLTGYDLKNREVGNLEVSAGDYFEPPASGISSNASELLDFANIHLNTMPEYLGLTHHLYTSNVSEGIFNTLKMGVLVGGIILNFQILIFIGAIYMVMLVG